MVRTRGTAAVILGAIALSALASGSTPAFQSRQPNIVVIVADDLGYADIGVHGSKDIPTPNIDAIARNGVRFSDAYVSGPFCSPTRAGLMTGKYPQRFGHEFNLGAGGDVGMPLTESTLADRLKAAGYRTALFGKWHLGGGETFHPMSRGFDEFFGFLSGEHSYLDVAAGTNNPLMDGRKVAARVEYLTDTLADRAVDFIRRNRAGPFFLYLAFNAVHTPMEATDKYRAQFAHITNPQRRTYAAMLAAMDAGIGQTMETLAEEKMLENTLVIFFSDNGGPTMTGTTINGSNNAPLRGSKRQTWEGGIRVPFMMQWNGRLPAGRVDSRPIIQLDILPTALAAAGVPIQSEWKLDGVSLLPFLTGENSGQPHEALYWRLGPHMAIRRGDWKLVKTQEGPLVAAGVDAFKDLSGAGLYNLAADISESRNLAATEPLRARDLAAAWQKWNAQLVTPLWGPGR